MSKKVFFLTFLVLMTINTFSNREVAASTKGPATNQRAGKNSNKKGILPPPPTYTFDQRGLYDSNGRQVISFSSATPPGSRIIHINPGELSAALNKAIALFGNAPLNFILPESSEGYKIMQNGKIIATIKER